MIHVFLEAGMVMSLKVNATPLKDFFNTLSLWQCDMRSKRRLWGSGEGERINNTGRFNVRRVQFKELL